MALAGGNRHLGIIWLVICTATLCLSSPDPESRLGILQGHEDGIHAFQVRDGVVYQAKSVTAQWVAVAATPGGKALSNPVVERGDAWGLVFVQAENGQVYFAIDIGDGVSSWKTVSPGVPLPHDAGATADISALVVLRDNTTVHLFAKTMEKETRLYWSRANASAGSPVFSDWSLVGGDKVHIQSAPAAAVNSFTGYVEVVAIMTDNKVYHTWQTSATSFHSWDKFSELFWEHDPEPQATPLLRCNTGKSIFNGRLEMFVYGTDGYIHHLGQTTCDKVMNPWSECTWGLYKKLDSHPVPTPLSKRNPLVVGNNAHGGIEVFTVDKSNRFWHLWQVEEGKDYHTWEQIGTSVYFTAPSIEQDQAGYWQAFAMDSGNGVREILQSRAMILKPGAGPISSGSNVTVSWMVPQDEATEADWIGIYRDGDSNDLYVDFAYVQGFQNPLHNAVPVGNLTRRSVLGNGVYNYRYLVNRKFVSVLQESLSFNNYTKDDESTQLYHGLAVGLGKEAHFFDACVEDGNHTVALLKEAFTAFEDRKIVEGLQLLGEALKDLQATLVACAETDIAKQLEKFIKDLISCTKGDCVHFVIDVFGELVSVFYENIHEIYGDIHGAKNCFKYELYEQGGINIGRVVTACIEGPDVSV